MSGITYPSSMLCRAQELRDGGWSLRETRRKLEEETGRAPSTHTILYWTSPDFREGDLTRKRAQRAAQGKNGRLGQQQHTPEWKVARMHGLRAEAGLKDTQIARVMAFDYGDVMSADTVARALVSNTYPRMFR